MTEIVRPGYKQTEVEVIPEDWEVARLGDCAQFRTGPFGSSLHKSDYIDDGVPVINPMHIVDGRIEPIRTMTITKKVAQNLADFCLDADEIIIGRRGDMGRCAVIQAHQIGSNKFLVPPSAVLVSKLNPRIPRVWALAEISENSIASTEFLVLIPEQIISRNFLYLVCSSTQFCEQMELAATGITGSHQRMNPMDMLNIKILVPPDNTEQTAIAAVLSDMDAEIAALERRRDKTRAIKQGMMQELLTGRVRLTLTGAGK